MDYFDNGREPPSSNRTDQEYRTTDVDLAAFLTATGIEPLRIEPPTAEQHPRHAALVFPLTVEVEDALEVWSSGQTTEISPKDYSATRHRLYRICRDIAGFGGGR